MPCVCMLPVQAADESGKGVNPDKPNKPNRKGKVRTVEVSFLSRGPCFLLVVGALLLPSQA